MRRILRSLPLLFAGLFAMFAVSWLIAMPDGEQRGVWRAKYGTTVLHLTPYVADVYHQFGDHCIHEMRFPAHMSLVKLMENAWIERQRPELWLHIEGTLEPQRFDPLDALPAACTRPDPATPPDVTFQAFWDVMNDHYAFFDLHGVDWSTRNLNPGPEASEAELLSAMKGALEGLDDGHLQLIIPEREFFSPSERPDWIRLEVFVNNDFRASLWESARVASRTELTAIPGTGLEYGLRDDGIGYIMIREMDVATTLGQSAFTRASDAFFEARAELALARGLIIDIRYNPGGNDAVAFAFASHFFAEPTPVLRKASRDGTGLGDWFEAVVPAHSGTPITQPTILLTSELTGSGAEIFTLALRTASNVTTMGHPTGGGLSDILGVTLPNGWLLGLSNQHYVTLEGELFEGGGIPPDVPVAMTYDDLVHIVDAPLEAAVAALTGN